MEFIGVSVAKEINTGKIVGNAYELGNEVYSSSTLFYDGYGEKMNHDITVVEEDIEIYKKANGNYVYKVIK